jgi:glycosyltransferase involved in cell wall biosynthesis
MLMRDVSITDGAVRKRVVIVTNIPAPYREPVYELLAAEPDIDLHVIYCSGREPDREWDLGGAKYSRTFLREQFVAAGGRFIHFNVDVWAALRQLGPDVVITTGFNPTHLIAFAYARLKRVLHIAMTDGTLFSEEKLSRLHRWIRRRVFARTASFIGASEGAFALYRSYRIDDGEMFKSHLCANNAAFLPDGAVEKRFDFIFCGRFVAIKNPFFALDMASRVAQRLGRKVSMVFVGSGELADEMRATAAAMATTVEVHFAGFSTQQDLPSWYAASKIFVFPTEWDPWGVVGNEACAAGVPTIVSPHAGVAGELIVDGETGYVLPLDMDAWVEAAIRLLDDDGLRNRLGAAARVRVADYSYANAAKGIAEAVRLACGLAPQAAGLAALRPVARRQAVLIVQRRMTHYRVPLFERLRVALAEQGVDLQVAYGDPTAREALNHDEGRLAWGLHVPVRNFLRGGLIWQNLSRVLDGVDMVIVTQENRLLFNYLLPLLYPKLHWAFWGHGRNFQARKWQSLGEHFKQWYLHKANWWFAYTEVSASVLRAAGYPAERITVLNNALDNEVLRRDLDSISADDLADLTVQWGIGEGPIGLMLGSLHSAKRLGFMLEAAKKIRERIPDFELLIVGDGPLRDLARAAAGESGWVHWLGALTGRDKARVLRRAQLIVNPGMVGLVVMDSLIAGTPLVTCKLDFHSPEIAYLDDGRNGVVTTDDVSAFADGVADLLGDPQRLARLAAACLVDAEEYTMARMVERFRDGILRSLPPQPARQGCADAEVRA